MERFYKVYLLSGEITVLAGDMPLLYIRGRNIFHWR